MNKYTIKHGLKPGKNLTTAQRSSSLFAEEPVVMGKVFRRGSAPIVISEDQYNRNRLQLTRLERAGSIEIVRPEDGAVEQVADLTTPPPVAPVVSPEPPAPEAPPLSPEPSLEPTPPVVPNVEPLVENPPVPEPEKKEEAPVEPPKADEVEVKEETKVEKKSKKGHK